MDPFVGEVRMVGYDFAPAGWALCNGDLMPMNQYGMLFYLLGTRYGGDGVTTFALPDMTGRVPIHRGQGQGLTQRNLGGMGGSTQITLADTQVPPHSHVPQMTSEGGDSMSPAGTIWTETGRSRPYSPATNLQQMAPTVVGTVGGSQPHVNLQPYLCVTFIIALEGLFPTTAKLRGNLA